MASIEQLNNRIAVIEAASFKIYEKTEAANARRLTAEYARIYSDIDKVINKLYNKYDELTISEMFRYNRLIRVQNELGKIIASLVPKTNALIASTITKSSAIGYFGVGWALESPVEMNFAFSQVSRETIEASIKNKYDLILWKDSNKANIARYQIDVKNKVSSGIMQGQSYSQMTKSLKEATKRASLNAERVMRTEAHRAHEAGRLAAFERAEEIADQIDMRIVKYWIATIDARTRPCHSSADGQIAKDGIFNVCGFKAAAPGLFGIAKMDIHCRCTTGTKVDDKMPASRRAQIEDKNINYMTFDEYMKNKKINIAA